MVIGKFDGVLEENLGKRYVVIGDIPDIEKAMTMANRLMKVNRNKLKVEPVYMDNAEDDEFSFEPYDGCYEALAVSRI